MSVLCFFFFYLHFLLIFCLTAPDIKGRVHLNWKFTTLISDDGGNGDIF